MKKLFAVLLAATMLVATALPVAAYEDTYPGSTVNYGFDAPATGEIIPGEPNFIGTNFSDDYNYLTVFDGWNTTYYAPENDSFGPQNAVYIAADTTYHLTEIRYVPREDKLERTVGLHFMGSNDGENWVDLYIEETQREYDYIIITEDMLLTDELFSYFGVFQYDETLPLNIAELEFWGYAEEPAVEEPEPEPVAEVAEAVADAPVVTSAQTADPITMMALVSGAALAGFGIAKRKFRK